MTKKHYFSEKKIVAAAAVILSAIYISLVWNNNVWMDEAFTASLVHTDFAGVIKRSMADTLPPLYNILLKLATVVFGYSTPVMKITSAVPMILTIITGATVLRRRFGAKCALLFMTFITLMPLTLYYGVEIRMYSLGFYFATVSGIYAYEVFAEPSAKNIIAFTLYSVLAGYSHHFAFVTVAFAYLYLLLYYIFFNRSKIRVWFGILAATFVLYLPCLIVTISQIKRVNGYFSMPDIDLRQFLRYMAYPYIAGFLPATIACMLLMAVSLAIFVKDVMIKKERSASKVYAICCFTVYYGVLVFGTLASKVMTANIFVDRYLFFAVGLLWLSAAIMLSGSDKTFYAALVIAVFIGIFTYSDMFETEYKNSADEEITFLRENVSEGDVLACVGGHEELQNCIPFYTYLDKDTAELEFLYPLEKAVEVSEERDTTLWIAVLDGSELSEDERNVLKEHGLSLEKAADFEFDRYRCGMYKVIR